MKLLIIGQNSYISNIFKNHPNIDFINRITDISNYSKYTHILNCTIQPNFFTKKLNIEDIIEVQLSRLLEKSQTLIFLSSRKVYKNQIYPDESSMLDFDTNDFYTYNKINADIYVQNNVKRHLILRISDILGPCQDKKYLIHIPFSNWVKEHTINGTVHLTESSEIYRDFITDVFLKDTIIQMFLNNQTGIFNIGSGIKITNRELFKKFNVAEKYNVIDNSFVLSVDKIKKYGYNTLNKKDILDYWLNILNRV